MFKGARLKGVGTAPGSAWAPALSRAATAPLGEGRGPEEPSAQGVRASAQGSCWNTAFCAAAQLVLSWHPASSARLYRAGNSESLVSGALRTLSTLLSVCVLSTLDQLRTFNYNHLEDPCILLMNLKGTWVNTIQNRHFSETLDDWHTNPSIRSCVSVI